MIQTEQLVAALERLESADREVLDLSLRRRVPDPALAEVLGCEPSDVPRRRAAAIDNLAEELGVQRGEDLGHMLKTLLEPETWAALGEASEERPEVRPPEGEVVAFAGPAKQPEPEPVETQAGEEESEEDASPAPVAAPPANGSGASTPVLEMLSDSEPQSERSGSRAVGWIIAGTLGALGLLGAGVVAGDSLLNGDDGSSPSDPQGGSPTRHFTPQKGGGPLAAPFPSEPTASCYQTATIRRPTVLHSEPGGRRKVKLSRRTEWRSPRVLSVVRQRGDWLAVVAAELDNGEVGWLRKSEAKLGCVSWSLHADLSQRALYVRKDGRTVRKLTVAIGRPSNPTPTGRFAVTDRLDVIAQNSPYGCCVLALSGHQKRLPAGWPGGDRLAVHATADVSSIGKPVSLGCMRATSREARWLIKTVPIGAPVFIRS